MKKHFLLISFISLLTLTLINLPFLYFGLKQDSTSTFLGRRPTNSQDTYTYLAFIEQARQGHNLFANLYSTENPTPSLLRPSYLLIGKSATLLGLTSLQAYHLSRLIFSLIFFLIAYKFIAQYFSSSTHRLIAYFIVLLSSGFPHLNWIPEATTFLSLGEAPHFILSQALMLLGFYFALKQNYLALIPFSLLALEHPFNLLVVVSTVLVAFLWSKKSLLKSLTFTFLSSLGLIYQYLTLQSNPTLASWQSQNLLLSPSPGSYLLGYAPLLPLALVGLESFFNQSSLKHKLLLAWALTSFLLAYAPISFQRRLIEGFHLPLSLLATSGLLTLSNHFKKHQKLLITSFLLLLPLGSLNYIYQDFKTISNPNFHYHYYLDTDELQALSWLGSNTTFSDTILANFDYGNLLPGLVGRRVYLGHNIQTTNLNQKIALTNSFLLDQNPISSLTYLTDNKINYIFLGKNDALIQYGFQPQNKPFLKLVYNHAGVTIYQVQQPASPNN